MSQQLAHINALHGNSQGYITLANKREIYKQHHYKLNELLDNVVNGENVYISQNSFYIPKRRLDTIKQLRNLYVDLDYYKVGVTRDYVLFVLQEDYYGKIPRPNLIIDSGRGLYLIWHIEAVPSSLINLWYAIIRYLNNELKTLGSDFCAIDPTRVLRLAGTINTKSNSIVEIIDVYDYKYTLRDIQEGYLPSVINKNPSKTGSVMQLRNTHNLHYHRLMDLVKLCKLRNYDIEGKREIICFLYRYWACCYVQDEQEALKQTLDFNAQFVKPLSEQEVAAQTRSAERAYKSKRYNYKNTTLIELLEITEEEQTQLETIISQNEKNRRRRAKKPNKRQESKLNKIKQVYDLKSKGYTHKEVSNMLNIRIGTVSKYWKICK